MPKPFPGPRLGDEIPFRWEKAEQEGPETGAFSRRPAGLLKFLVGVKAQHGEMVGDGGAGCGLGIVRLHLESLMLGPDLPASYRLCIERGKK